MKISWKIKTWEQLKTNELYSILKLRSKVFVVEQNCVYQDIDDKDKLAIHVFGFVERKIIAYSRLFNKKEYFKETSFGRAVVESANRGKGIGDMLVEKSLLTIKEKYKEQKVKISAQAHLVNFYKKHGFKTIGKEYLEDGIPHIAMLANIR
ncbi:MAG: GNAT family N-acetyltransferase [Flavobacteriaceae bacterium]